jgi:hypothetical protein
MKARIILAFVIALSLGSWITVPENEPVKAKLLFESVLYHFM